MGPVSWAHTVPTITVEAEFSAGREVTLRVNLDPRLFLSEHPTSLPPVPATWWLEQNEAARASSMAMALAYLEKSIRLQAGDFRIGGGWTVSAIDSASAFPLGPNSAETHLLAELRIPLPDAAGDFKVTLDQSAAVGLILLNSTAGKAERYPQAIFPGESSRGFKLPEKMVVVAKSASTVSRSPAPSGSRHFAGDHLLVALVMAWLFRGRFIMGVIMLAVFQLSQVSMALAVTGAWLPDAPFWMRAAGWFALAAAFYLSHQRQLFRAAACFSVAGLCHGLNVPHLHLAALQSFAVLRDAGLTGAMQLAVFTLASAVVNLILRRQLRGKVGTELC